MRIQIKTINNVPVYIETLNIGDNINGKIITGIRINEGIVTYETEN